MSIVYLLIIALLMLVNGFFSLSEFAIVNAKRPRLQAMADAKRWGAGAAIALAEDENRFLSTVQIGITLVSILTGIMTGSSIGEGFALVFQRLGLKPTIAVPVSYALIVAVVTYLSVVVGELVPKRVALRAPEAVACVVAPLMNAVSRIFAPAVWLLGALSEVIFRSFALVTPAESGVSDQEIHAVVADAESAGVIEPTERRLIAGVMRLGDQRLRSIMTPRADVAWIDLSKGDVAAKDVLTRTLHSYVPVGNGSIDTMIGVVDVRAYLHDLFSDKEADVRNSVRTAPVLTDSAEALQALTVLQEAEVPVALIYDEFGHFEGMATPVDILSSIVGAFRAELEEADLKAVQSKDGSWQLPGALDVKALTDTLAIPLPPEHDYRTVAGFVLEKFQEFPTVGQNVEAGSWRLEVTQIVNRRIVRVTATRQRAT